MPTILFRVRALSETDGGHVAGERVEPHVEHVLRRVSGTGMPQVIEVRLIERSFKPPLTNETISLRRDTRANEIRLIVVELEQLVLKRAEMEEIIFFGQALPWDFRTLGQFSPSSTSV